MFNQAFSEINENCGLGLHSLMSYPAPAFKNRPTSSELILPALVRILKHIINTKVILSFSNNPLFTYL